MLFLLNLGPAFINAIFTKLGNNTKSPISLTERVIGSRKNREEEKKKEGQGRERRGRETYMSHPE